MISINEIFYSIQGEGLYAGQPMVFVRVAGCNLQCEWCDQPDTIVNGYKDREGKLWSLKYTKMLTDEVYAKVKSFGTHHVCLTGGEPSIHSSLDPLVRKLHADRFHIHMETNGLRWANWMWYVHTITASPKRGHPCDEVVCQDVTQFKFIVDEEFTMEETQPYQKWNKPMYLQPANQQNTWDSPMVEKTLGLVLANPTFRMSNQLHKALGVR
jgi:organic radical activating enzyme